MLENKDLNVDPDLEGIVPDPALLFEQEAVPVPTGSFPEKEEKKPITADSIDVNDIPLPSKAAPADENEEDEEFSADKVIELITSRDENGYSPSVIVAAIEKLHNITPDMTLENIPEENIEFIDDIEIEDCSVDMYTLDGEHINVKLTFDNVKSAYLRELNDLLNRYRFAQESIQDNEEARDGDTFVMFSLTFVPKNTSKYVACQATFPISYDRVLDDNDVNCSMALVFMAENIQCQMVNVSEEEETEMVANAMRAAEQGTGGDLFEYED